MVLAGFGQRVEVFRGDDQGWVVPCVESAGAWEHCDPIRPTTLDALAEAVRPGPELEHGQAPVAGDRLAFTVGGEAAYVIRVQAYEVPDRGSEWVDYIVTIHAGRPYVVRMWTPEESGIVGLNDLIDGFRFLPTEASDALLRFDWPDLGFGLAVPQSWLPEERPATGVLRLGPLQPNGAGDMLDISIGGPDGTISLCTPNCIEYEGQDSIDELEQTLRASTVDGGPPRPTLLGGVDARAFRSVWKVAMYRISTRTSVFAIHDGRPIVLSFDVEIGSPRMDRIVETFRFLAPPESNDGVVAWAEGGVSLTLLDGWKVTASDASRIRLERGSQVLTIARGDDEGWIQPCTRPAGPFERCDPIPPTSLDELVDQIGYGWEPRTPVVLDGESAFKVSNEAQELLARGGQWVGYVVAMHDRRPYAIRLWTPVGTGNYLLQRVVAGFHFVDAKPSSSDRVFTTANGKIEMHLPAPWYQSAKPDLFIRASYWMSVRVGGSDGSIVTCDRPAGPWEACREIQAKTLDDLAAAVQPLPKGDHGLGPTRATREDRTLDGEPSVVTRIRAYAYPARENQPARGGQEVVYIATIHDGRPYLIRIKTHFHRVLGLDDVIAGVHFVD